MEICKQNCMNMSDEYDHLNVETMVNHPSNELYSTLKNSMMSTNSTQQLDAIIESAIMKKKDLDLTTELVTNLIKEVEFEEKVAEQVKEEAAQFSIDTLVILDERKKAMLEQQQINSMLVTKVDAEKNVLGLKTELLYRRVERMLDVGDKSLNVLKEMREGLNLRLNSALKENELSTHKMQENELALVNQTIELNNMVEEFDKLKQETLENSKLQMLLNDRDTIVDNLKGEISNKSQDVNVLKEDLQKEEVEIPSIDSNHENLDENKDCVTEEKVAMSSEDLREQGKPYLFTNLSEGLREQRKPNTCTTLNEVFSSRMNEKKYKESDALNKLRANRTGALGIERVPENHEAAIHRYVILLMTFSFTCAYIIVFWF